MTDWQKVIRRICPHARADIAQGVAEAMPAICDQYGLDSTLRQAHFLAQIAHESDGLHTTVEYASGRAYEGRADLGNVKQGDGVRFKGRGLIQLTGRANYQKYGALLGVDLVGNPEAAGRFPVAIETAGLYWKLHGLNRYADADDVNTITRRINGGYNGLADRRAYLAAAKRAIGAAPLGLIAAEAVEGGDPKVVSAQDRLKALGYFPGASDGRLGAATRAELVKFQADNGLDQTGDLDAATLDTLASAMTKPRPLPESRTQATVADLREKGSETIKAADEAEQGLSVKTVASTAGLGFVTETVASASSAKDALSQLPDLVQWGLQHATLIVLVLVLGLIWYERKAIKAAIDRIREARAKDHRSGANMGR